MESLQTFLIVLSSVKGSWYHLKRLGVAWELDMIHVRAWDRCLIHPRSETAAELLDHKSYVPYDAELPLVFMDSAHLDTARLLL